MGVCMFGFIGIELVVFLSVIALFLLLPKPE
ncbi:hypothetical protein SAMN05421757_11330 [Tropicimonas sediminicola]|uniref:Uncharacterized protein n=1 Tax=Tropicimonas sediminicola TaxID=1031541 RepID=A0A239M639_9RHOB|nr:hypothetical protein SAMN05421757_11330 [Tropicimonas sediminicola]